VIVGRNVGRSDEAIQVVDLETLDPESIDMSTVVLVGSSTTRVIKRPVGSSVYTPRTYPSARL
jgi:precorrin-3B methylase